jgi:hypothetical protein
MRNLSIQSIKALEVIRKENAVLRQDFLHMKQEVDAEIYKALEMVAHYRSKVMQVCRPIDLFGIYISHARVSAAQSPSTPHRGTQEHPPLVLAITLREVS